MAPSLRVILALSLLTLCALRSQAQTRTEPPFTPDAESNALAFVTAHHPELARLLKRLEPMNRAEYEKAIIELDAVARSLEAQLKRDERRYELSLAHWKARSRAELLAAQLAGVAPSSTADRTLQARLRQALDDQFQAELERQRYDQQQAEARARRMAEITKRLEGSRERLVEQRFQNLLRKSRGRVTRPRDQVTGAAAPVASPRAPGDAGDPPR